MCGIVGYLGKKDSVPIILDGLHRLEYRGYDSAGIAVMEEGEIQFIKNAGKVSDLSRLIDDSVLKGSIGIGHTRWATHGKPNERNAHPHRDVSGEVAVVQNGIIENHRAFRASKGKAIATGALAIGAGLIAGKILSDIFDPKQGYR